MILYSWCIQDALFERSMTTRRARAPATGKTKPQLDGTTPVDAKIQRNGDARTPPPSPWQARTDRQADRQVEPDAGVRAAAHDRNHEGKHHTAPYDSAVDR